MKDTSAAKCDIAPDIVMTASFWRELSTHLLRPLKNNRHSPDEQLAFILASSNNSAQRRRLLAREMLKAGPEDLVEQGPAAIKPRPEFVMHALNRCRNENLHLIEVHSHPFSYGEGTTFSGIDWRNDEGKMPGLAHLLPEMIHVTMVMGRDSLDAHYYDRTTKSILPVEQVVVVGAEADKHTPAVIFLNGVIASLQVAEVLFLLAGTHVEMPLPIPPLGLYNAFERTMTAVTFHASPMCPTCGDEGVLAVGDLAPLRPATSLAPAATNGVDAAIPLNASIATEISVAQPSENGKEAANGPVEDLPGTALGLLTDLSESSVVVAENVPGTQETDDGLVTDVSEMEKSENLQTALVASNGNRNGRFRNWLKQFFGDLCLNRRTG